jgi:hypothetical protein
MGLCLGHEAPIAGTANSQFTICLPLISQSGGVTGGARELQYATRDSALEDQKFHNACVYYGIAVHQVLHILLVSSALQLNGYFSCNNLLDTYH